MSWVDKIKSDLIILTGDGKIYKPDYLYPSKSKEYNISTFEFPNVSGSLVDRRLPKGTKYPLQLYFQGENHLDIAKAFEKSADDPRPWTLIHPYYGRIIVQPTSLEIDNSKMNVSEIKTEVIETITQDYPKTSVVPQDKIANSVEDVNISIGAASINKIESVGIKPLTVSKTAAFINKSNAKISKVIKVNADAAAFTNKYNTLKASVNKFSSEAEDTITQTVDLLKTVADLPISVQEKTAVYTGLLQDTQSSFLSGTVNLIDKFLYMTNAGSIIAAMCLSVAKPQSTDYSTRNDVLSTIDVLLDANNVYVQLLDSVQSPNGGSLDSFVPDASSLIELNNLLNYTISNLFNIALDAKQERSIVLEEDSNWIVLAHRFYGLKADDSTIEQMIRNNNAGLNEMLQVKKNRKIIYYV